MLRVGICDDESAVRESLRLSLQQILRKENRIYEFSSGEGLLGWMEKHMGEIDLLFLDVEMHELSGMETARRLRAQDRQIVIVFVTGYPDYVFDGYSVGALDYLLKPVPLGRLEQVVKRAMTVLHMAAPENFTLKNADGIFRIPRENILYFYSDRRLVNLVTQGKSYTFYDKLDHVQQVAGPGFVRIHQRYLVRAAAVRQIEDDCVLIGGRSLPISRACRQGAMLAFARELLEGGQAPT